MKIDELISKIAKEYHDPDTKEDRRTFLSRMRKSIEIYRERRRKFMEKTTDTMNEDEIRGVFS